MFLSLERIGWTFDSYHTWTDDIGTTRVLTEFGPKLFDIFMKASVKRRDERAVAVSMGHEAF